MLLLLFITFVCFFAKEIDKEEQLLEQLGHMALLARNEKVKNVMVVFLQDNTKININVVKILGDGNCLYRAIVHQVFKIPTTNAAFEDTVVELRQQITSHVLANIKKKDKNYIIEVKNTMADKYKKCVNDYTEKDCENFVEYTLTKDGIWGGGESIRAATELLSINIYIISEKSKFYSFVPIFNQNNRESIILAYRTFGKTSTYYHYDSVFAIDTANLKKLLARSSRDILDLTEIYYGKSYDVIFSYQ